MGTGILTLGEALLRLGGGISSFLAYLALRLLQLTQHAKETLWMHRFHSEGVSQGGRSTLKKSEFLHARA